MSILVGAGGCRNVKSKTIITIRWVWILFPLEPAGKTNVRVVGLNARQPIQ